MEKPHKKLDVWKLSMVLARAIYRLTADYPTEERFGLVSQISAVQLLFVLLSARSAVRKDLES